MSTDRELLELAARAVGIAGEWVENYGSGDYYYQGNSDGIYYEHAQGGYSVWNPLTDDGDTLRLAVALNIDIQPREFGCYASICAMAITVQEIGEKGPAARRAVVRAAVEYWAATS